MATRTIATPNVTFEAHDEGRGAERRGEGVDVGGQVGAARLLGRLDEQQAAGVDVSRRG